jgi:hypothetical protein
MKDLLPVFALVFLSIVAVIGMAVFAVLLAAFAAGRKGHAQRPIRMRPACSCRWLGDDFEDVTGCPQHDPRVRWR